VDDDGRGDGLRLVVGAVDVQAAWGGDMRGQRSVENDQRHFGLLV